MEEHGPNGEQFMTPYPPVPRPRALNSPTRRLRKLCRLTVPDVVTQAASFGPAGTRHETGTDGSGRELGAALAATRRHDGATRAGPHPETEPVDPRPTTVVRLERPLALGHGLHSSSWWTPGDAR